jgi:uncharacterized protein
MPHLRTRLVTSIIKKRFKLWPILGVLGVRQSGKSTLLREIIAPAIGASYKTMDSKTEKSRASKMPETFLEISDKSHPLIVDEVQKAPDLFDALKLHVDKKRYPGSYLISGSTEFSKKTGIRESLTGRIGTLQIYPLNLSEIYKGTFSSYFLKKTVTQSVLSLANWDKKLEWGGMPGICFLRSEQERNLTIQQWLETTCYRDIMNVDKGKFDGVLAFEILSALAKQEEPNSANVAKALAIDSRVASRYLEAFTSIFVTVKLRPHESGIGKDLFLITDSGIAHFLGASRNTLIRIHLLIEALSHFENAGLGKPIVKYYKSRKGAVVPLVFDWLGTRGSPTPIALNFAEHEAINQNHFKRLKAFQTRSQPFRLLYLMMARESYLDSGVEIYPLLS